jgi:RimJ/RimL family protein N-acetyltransferase
MKTVDGRGVQRVLRAMGCRTITVRDATPADVDTIFSWRNHPEVRSVSRNTSPIEKSDHKAWLDSVFADPARMLLVGERGGEDVGLVRFDLRETEAVVSIYLAPDLIETGIGIELLSAAESWLLERRANVLTLHAEVLRDNERSHRLFEGSGYKRVSTVYEKNLGQNE